MNPRSKEATLKSLVRKMELEIGEIARTQGVTESKFKQILGYDDYYVSEDGVVASTKFSRVKFLKYDTTFFRNRGYKRVSLGNTRAKYPIHRLVALAFLKPSEGKNIVNHIDGDKANNHVSNLEWTNTKGNLRHYHGMSKQSNSHINELKQAYKQYKNDPEQFMNFFAKTVMAK